MIIEQIRVTVEPPTKLLAYFLLNQSYWPFSFLVINLYLVCLFVCLFVGKKKPEILYSTSFWE